MDPFDCQEFHELCMDYRGAAIGFAQEAYECLQAYCRAKAGIATVPSPGCSHAWPERCDECDPPVQVRSEDSHG